jgi:uncharacterized protein
MKYLRYYPWGLQILLFLLMIITMMGFASTMLFVLLPKFTGFNPAQLEGVTEQSSPVLINASLMAQGILNAAIFLLPAVLFAYLSTPRPAAYLGLRAPGKTTQMVLVVLIMIGALPMLNLLESLVGLINFGPKIKAEQAANDAMMGAFMNMSGTAAFLRAFIVLAVIPAVGEELFFRGVLMRFARKYSRSMVFPVIFSAVVFSYSHTNIYGYLSIFLAGVLLAVIYNITGSIWCSIVAHLVFNGTTLLVASLSGTNVALKTFLESKGGITSMVIGGTIIFCVAFYLLLRNKTPLPNNWTDDFTPAELSQKAD